MRVPNDGAVTVTAPGFPPATGARRWVQRIPPDDAETGEAHGGSKMHVSQTVDVIAVLDGEIWLVMENGYERRLTTGDVVIQNGTLHQVG